MIIKSIKLNTKFKALQSNPTQNVQMPTSERNYCIFNQTRVDEIVEMREKALPQLKQTLRTSQDEKEIVETLYIIDRMADKGVKGIPAMYPDLAKFNETKSPNIQSYLAGIYRKTQVPDAFGPLISMLIKNSIEKKPEQKISKPSFDPNEEIGGAILEYIRNYSQGPKPIDFSA